MKTGTELEKQEGGRRGCLAPEKFVAKNFFNSMLFEKRVGGLLEELLKYIYIYVDGKINKVYTEIRLFKSRSIVSTIFVIINYKLAIKNFNFKRKQKVGLTFFAIVQNENKKKKNKDPLRPRWPRPSLII